MSSIGTSVVVTVLIVIVLNIVLASCVLPPPCPVWFVYDSNECKCGKTTGIGDKALECSESQNSTTIRNGYCLTFDNVTQKEHFGACPYNTGRSLLGSSPLPSDVFELDKAMCGPLNRTGLLCSQCQPGLGPAVLSKYRECKKCVSVWVGWILLLLRITVPATILCVIVIVFRVNIGSPALNIFVLTAHQISYVFNTNPFIFSKHHSLYHYSIEKFVVDVYGLFSLDFFNFGIPTFCIQEDMSMLTVIALDYIAVVYPLLFIVLVYYCITIHDSGRCKIIVICWRPFQSCLAKCRHCWNVKGSVINAFTTIVIFSYNKICFTSFYLFQLIQVYDKNGSKTHRPYFAAQYGIYSREYIAHATLGSVVTLSVIILPVVFICVQSTRFRNCPMCRINIVLIREMVTLLQSGFKDGTSKGTHDYRWFAGFYLLLRAPFVFFFGLDCRFVVYVSLYSILAVLVTVLRPYKVERYNILDSTMWLISVIAVAWYSYCRSNDIHWHGMLYAIGSFPLVYALLNACLVGIPFLIKWQQSRATKQQSVLTVVVPDENTSILPDRLLNPKRYNALT